MIPSVCACPMALRVFFQFMVNSSTPDEHAYSNVESPFILSKDDFGKWLPLPLFLLHASQKRRAMPHAVITLYMLIISLPEFLSHDHGSVDCYEPSSISFQTASILALFCFAASLFLACLSRRSARRQALTSRFASLHPPKSL